MTSTAHLMRPALRVVASVQRGLVTRRQCEVAGYSTVELRQLTRTHGPWVVVRRAVYAERETWEAASALEQWGLRDLAAHLTAEVEHAMSHDSSARAWGIPLLRPRRELSHLTREGVRGGRTEAGVSHHLTRCGLGEITVVRGLPVMTPARTGLDLAREHGLAAGVAALDDVRARGVSLSTLENELEVMQSWRGVRTVRRAVALSDPRAESPAESLARLLLVEMGYTDIDVAWPIRVGGRTYWTDLRVGCHVFEVDGLVKYLDPADGGVARKATREVLRDERRRQADICGEGLGMSRFLFDDLFGRAREALAARLEREEALTRQRFGPTLPAHLAEQGDRIRRQSPRRRPPR
ncbi:hypothetical protein [Nocardioides sp. CFH 31398]|uniref:hypothetical protein n=1 Tax=Nocardioides sp. CFH 31398 TaxID=2919579 RepID=UPI001F069C43|nr:hypothetical protein [Nocardioides sp. CFH 31398]MCH1865714.1 hypothetical protein [Nocardioides sp. CFH 31398]